MGFIGLVAMMPWRIDQEWPSGPPLNYLRKNGQPALGVPHICGICYCYFKYSVEEWSVTT